MASCRREFNKQETLRHIRSTFIELYAQGGINNITIAELCQKCGIAKSTFYLYYEDKYQVLEKVENEVLDGLRAICYDLSDCDMTQVLTGEPLEKAYNTVLYIKKNAATFRALLGKYGDPSFSYKWKKDIIESFMGRFKAEKGDTPSASIACVIFSSSLIGLYTHFLFDMPEINEHEFSIILGNLLKYSLFDFHAFAE